MKPLKIIIEKHPDGYVAYPLGVKGVVVGEGDTYEEALADVKSAMQFHVETFGKEVLGCPQTCGRQLTSHPSGICHHIPNRHLARSY